MKSSLFLLTLTLGMVGFQAAPSHATPKPFSCGRLQNPLTGDQLDPTKTTISGTTCIWVCAETAQDAAQFCAGGGRPVPPAGPLFVMDPRSCTSPRIQPTTQWSGTCCRPAPYSDVQIVANGLDGQTKLRAVSNCAGPAPAP